MHVRLWYAFQPRRSQVCSNDPRDSCSGMQVPQGARLCCCTRVQATGANMRGQAIRFQELLHTSHCILDNCVH